MLTKETIDLEDKYIFLDRKPGRPAEAVLFIWTVRHFRARIRGKVRRWTVRRKGIQGITGPTKAHINRQIAAFANRRDVRLMTP